MADEEQSAFWHKPEQLHNRTFLHSSDMDVDDMYREGKMQGTSISKFLEVCMSISPLKNDLECDVKHRISPGPRAESIEFRSGICLE